MLERVRIQRPSPGTALGLLALIVATSGVAVAAIPGADRTVTGCISRGGELRVIDGESGDTCPGSHTTVKLAVTDAAGKVSNSDLLDGKDSTDFLGATAKAADADLLDGKDSTAFLGVTAKAADANLLDGKDSSDFLGATAKAADADLLDGKDSSDFLGATAKAVDANLLDGMNSTAFLQSDLIVRSSDTSLASGFSANNTTGCAGGELALGGGVQLITSSGIPLFAASSPVLFSRPQVVPTSSGVPSPRGWEAAMSNGTSSAQTMRIWVICAG